MPPTLLPPKRLPAPAAAVPTAPAAEAAPAPAATTEAAPAPTPVPKKATVPTPTPKKLAPPKKTPPKATAKIKPAKKAAPPKKAAVKRAPPVKRATSPKPATENVVPKVPKIRTSHWSEEAVELAVLVHDMKQIVPAVSKKRVELRSVTPRLQVLLNEKLGVPCQLCYSLPEHVSKIVKLLKKVPAEVLPFKWPGAFERIDKFLDKLK